MDLDCQKSPYTNIFVDASLQAVHIACEGLVPSDTFRRTLLYVMELIKSNNLLACIYDIRQLKSIPPQDQDWFIDEVLPLLMDAPIRKVAVLEAANGTNLLDLNQLVYSKYLSIPFELQYFEDVASALEWVSKTTPLENNPLTSSRKSLASAL
ncbi:hypothetical protein [Rufibacter hautae]|uniref:STAS/SEC14 domain-containing protein n=1 Tax=Rufibacter hautae TaxID=2595005 RepID=A0A5B6TJ30_9BACT|nr:hypothetical protein [Rufibacter hautae]KAA3440684.1 hypothetical protein FOA19_08555 [Rufibacter hautae]